MKKIALALVLVLVLAMVALVGVGAGGFFMSKDEAIIYKLARSFLTDLQFKDFEKAASYHTLLDSKKANIPKLIEKLFAVKPELLNIREFEIVKVEMDPDGKRAKAFFRSTGEILNTAKDDKPNKEKEVEGILYWHKLPSSEGAPGAPTMTTTDPAAAEAEKWFMKLESSLH